MRANDTINLLEEDSIQWERINNWPELAINEEG